MQEIWDLYTWNRIKTGRTHVRGTPVPEGFCHVVVEVWTVIDHSEILMTLRHPDKPYGRLWECTGGSILSGETSIQGAAREIQEETGLPVIEDDLFLIANYSEEDSIYDVYVNYQTRGFLENLSLQETEVIDSTTVTLDEFRELLGQEKMVPKLKYLLDLAEDGRIRLNQERSQV